jgi:hypothetical protein
MLFNAESFRTGDEEILIRGLAVHQENNLKRESPL